MSAEQNDRLVGTLLDDRYEILSRIARGGMAKVYLARDIRLEREVAIKIMHDHLTDDDDYATKFVREARHTAKLAHPNIMAVFDQGHVDGTLYLVMEYLPGMTLRELLNDYGTLTVEQALDISSAVLQGLGVAHREGILHRDVKPENVILVNDGRIKIGDFGLARPVNNATDTGKSLLGTVAYIAPELLTRTQADNRSDLYSVGIMLYEMLTGKQPFVGETPMQIAVQHAQQPMPFASDLNPTVSRGIDDVIQWSTQKNPNDRPRDARAMLDALRVAVTRPDDDTVAPTRVIEPARTSVEDNLETQRALPTIPDAPTTPFTSFDERPARMTRPNKRLVLIIAALLVALVVGGTGWWYLAGPGSVTTSVDVTGLSAEQATSALTAAGYVVVDPNDSAYDATIPVDSVVTTNPAVTVGLPKGTEVHLVLSLGPKPIAFPDYVGATTADFTSQLSKLGIDVVDTLRAFSTDVPSGEILGVTNESGHAVTIGDTVYAGDKVTLTESVGTMPVVKGLSVDDATTALEAAKLTVDTTTIEKFSTTIAAGLVIGLDGGKTIHPGDTVKLIVSKGPEMVTIPDLSGKSIGDGRSALEALGFTVNVITDIPQKHWSQSWTTVLRTDPAAGTTAPKGTTIDLYGGAS
jgi:serine/threonine-protein kinase